MSFAEMLEEAMMGTPVSPYGMDARVEPAQVSDGPPGDHGFLVKCVKLSNDAYPGRGAHGILPVFVVGHVSMSESAWREWVRKIGTEAYGPAYTERCLREGIDLKQMVPTAAFGRSMRLKEGRRSTNGRRYLDQATYLMNVVDKWPSLYNVIVMEMGEEVMTLGAFVDRVSTLPSPHEVGEGQHSTLGDLIGRGMMLLPDY